MSEAIPKKAPAAKTEKKPPALLSENDLPAYDKEALANQRALIKAAEDCKEAQQAAQKELKEAGDAKKALDKKAPDYKAKSKELDARIKQLSGSAKKKCPGVKKACVPSENEKKGTMSKAMNDSLNKKHGTNVDLAPIAQWEGGVFLKAYIPWWPDTNGTEPILITRTDSNGVSATRLTGTVVAGTGGKRNNSGPTIAKGVDFGPQASTPYFEVMDAANAEGKYLTDEQLKALKEKIKPYFGMRAGEACKYLQEHPLEITQAESDLLNHGAADTAIKDAKRKWNEHAKTYELPSFDKLTQQQQTSLVSNVYQTGNLNSGVVSAIQNNNRDLIPNTRERTYLYNAMPAAPPPAPPKPKG